MILNIIRNLTKYIIRYRIDNLLKDFLNFIENFIYFIKLFFLIKLRDR